MPWIGWTLASLTGSQESRLGARFRRRVQEPLRPARPKSAIPRSHDATIDSAVSPRSIRATVSAFAISAREPRPVPVSRVEGAERGRDLDPERDRAQSLAVGDGDPDSSAARAGVDGGGRA